MAMALATQTTHQCKMQTHQCCIYAKVNPGQIDAIKIDVMTLFLTLNANANGASTQQQKMAHRRNSAFTANANYATAVKYFWDV
jgi:hypothetical protein